LLQKYPSFMHNWLSTTKEEEEKEMKDSGKNQ
jgi:hypothetical protein